MGRAAVMEGIHAFVARVDALFLEDAWLEGGGPEPAADAGMDLLQRGYEVRLERLAAVKQLEAQLAAVKARDAAEAIDIQHAMTPPDAPVHERTYTEMSAVEEIAGVLTISSAAAGARASHARQLSSLPLAMDALSAGTISWQHARIIADEADGLGPAGAASLVAHFLDPDVPNPARGAAAGELVPSRFRVKVRGWRERHHPESMEKRHAKCAADRRMEYNPDRDGMAWLSLYLPADTANAVWNRATALARGLQGPEEPRTMTQLRPDVAAHLLLRAAPTLSPVLETSAADNRQHTTKHRSEEAIGLASLGIADLPKEAAGGTATFEQGNGRQTDADAINHNNLTAGPANDYGHVEDNGHVEVGSVPVPNAQVLVTVPVFALLGLTDEPAMLDGHGPIPAAMARKLLAVGATSFHRVLVDPRDGAPLEMGRTSYRLTKAMKRALTLRDGKCTFPGCNNRSPDNETDHLQAWQHGGTTGISNLAQLCPKHHRLKHNRPWAATSATRNEPPGWTSPTGRHYKAEHPNWEPPVWPPGILPILSRRREGSLPPARR